MPRDITVTFEDGAIHVYRGAPDDVTPEAVQQRAEKQFGKAVTALDGGRKAGLAAVDSGGRGEMVADGVRPSNLAGAGRSASVGGLMPSEIPAEGLDPARRGTMRAARPFVAGDERVAAPPEAFRPPPMRAAGVSVLDRPAPTEHERLLAQRQQEVAPFDPYDTTANVTASRNPDPAVQADAQARAAAPAAAERSTQEQEARAKIARTPGWMGDSAAGTAVASVVKQAPNLVRAVGAAMNLGTGAFDNAIRVLEKAAEGLDEAKSRAMRRDAAGLRAVMADPNASANDVAAFLATHPGILADTVVDSLPSMALSVAGGGALGAAGTRLVAGAASKSGMSAAALRGEMQALRSQMAGMGSGVTNVALNAGDTFSDPRLARESILDRLNAAAIAGAGTVLAGRLTSGGAERALATGARPGALRLGSREGAQEVGETIGQSAGVAAGSEAETFDPNAVAKEAVLAGAAGFAAGAGPAALASRRANPYAQAAAAGFHVEPPLLTDTPQDQRKKTEAILDNVAAMYGVPPKVVQMLRAGAEGKPLAELGPAYARGIQWLQQRGLVPADIATEVMQALGHGAIQPIAEQPAAAPVAESQAPGRSADGEGGAAPTRAGGGPQPSAQDAAVSGIEATLRGAGALADMSDFEAATHEAATSPLNDLPEPTDAQKAAGNYKVGRVRVSGLDVSIENPAGSVRRSAADAPKPWEVVMPAAYGYIRGTKGADGDHVDIFVGPGGDNGRFWVINQNTPDGKKFDEHKVVTGVDTADEAVALYKASFADNFGDRVFASIGTEMGAQQLRDLLPSLERPKPAKARQVRLQNRNRSDAGYVQQMQSIAAKPDPGRLGFSRDFASGAPVVLDAGSTPGAAYGRTDYVTSSKGRRIPVRYAVVEAESLLPSNTADGGRIAEYEAGAPGRARVVAGNGRAAGLVAGYGKGKADAYRSGLAEDAALHGIDAEALARFKQPVLVREMRGEDVTADIGDESNVSGIAERSSPEVARDDARRIDLAALEFDEDGGISDAALRRFVDSMPVSEQTALRDARGNPTRQAADRLTSAVFAAAYENDAMLALQAQATDPEARTVLAGLVAAAPAMVQLRGTTHDIRALAAEAAIAAVNARRRGIKLADMAAQADLDADPEILPVLEMFARNIRSAKRIGDNLRTAATRANEEASRPAEDMFGEVPRRTRQQVLTESFDDTTSAQDLGEQAGAEPAARTARRRGTEPDSTRGVERPAGSGAGEAEGERTAPAGRAELIELRKRLSVLESLRACLSS